jgi:hypothetical protein
MSHRKPGGCALTLVALPVIVALTLLRSSRRR